MSQGCRPISAVIHPAVFAMNGKGSASMITQSHGRAAYRRFLQSSATDTSITAMKMVPSPTMM